MDASLLYGLIISAVIFVTGITLSPKDGKITKGELLVMLGYLVLGIFYVTALALHDESSGKALSPNRIPNGIYRLSIEQQPTLTNLEGGGRPYLVTLSDKETIGTYPAIVQVKDGKVTMLAP